MLYLNMNAWCARFEGDCKEELVETLIGSRTPDVIRTVLTSNRIQIVGWFVYLHLDERRRCWMLPRSLN